MFHKKGVLKKFAKRTRKCLYQSFFLNKVAGLRPATLLKKETLAQVFSCTFCEISKNTFFYRTPPVAASPNRGYLHCAILKALHGFQEKRALKSKDMQFFLQNVPNEIFKIFKMFENNMKFTRATCWINSKISDRDQNTKLTIFLFCHCCWLLLWCSYWKSLKSEFHHHKTLLYLLFISSSKLSLLSSYLNFFVDFLAIKKTAWLKR